ncbi:MAG: ABC transporter ATP-binding protein [bacterium JZ-2024 1]
MKAVISLQAVHKNYGKTRALDGINLEIHSGEIFGILGPNGAGKTTLLLLLAGVEEPTSGTITLWGMSTENLAIRSRIGFLPETFSSHEFLTIEETLFLFARFFISSTASIRKRTEEILHRLKLWEHRKKKLSECSKGMVRKVGFACSIIHSPEIWLLDEPTIGLDPSSSAEVKKMVKENRERGGIVVLSSHILSELERICDRVALLNKGKVVRCAPLSELLQFSDRIHLALQGGSPDLHRYLKQKAVKTSLSEESIFHYWIPREEEKNCLKKIAEEETARLLLHEVPRITLEDFFLEEIH